MSITRDSLVYLDDFLPLELDEARSGIGESDVGGAEPRAVRLEELVLLEAVLVEAGLLEAAAEAGFARASAALKIKDERTIFSLNYGLMVF